MIRSVGHLDALLRGLVLGKLGKAGHKPTLEEARRRFRGHVEGKQILPADLRSPVSDSAVYGRVPVIRVVDMRRAGLWLVKDGQSECERS